MSYVSVTVTLLRSSCKNLIHCKRRWFVCSNFGSRSILSFARAMSDKRNFTTNFFFRQLIDRESCTYSYLLADQESKECVFLDPVIGLAERDAQIIRDLNFTIKYAINTHMHADHITGSGALKKFFPNIKSAISVNSGAKADMYLKEGDKLNFGTHVLEVIETPGHTAGCISFVCREEGVVFTGDTLLIRGCGRTDFQEGNSSQLYDSVHQKIFSLPNNYRICPAHDYKGHTESTVGEEKKYNPRLTKSKPQFVELMAHLNLPYPKMIDKALPANKVCGLYELPENLQHLV